MSGKRRAVAEIVAVIVTGTVHLIFEEALHAKGPFIAIAALGWTGYVVLRFRTDREVIQEWGLGLRGSLPAVKAALVVLAVGTAGVAAISISRGTLRFHWHILPLFAVYPVWGVVQQFLIQALVARNLQILFPARGHVVPIALVCALLFGVVHWPDTVLMAATLLLGLVFTPVYLKTRWILPLGVVHGWLGALAYFWLLERDPVAELLATR